MTPGFLLTRQWVDAGEAVRLDFWLSTAEGPLMISIHGQQALFFIRQSDVPAATELLANSRGSSIKPLQLKNFAGEAISGVYFTSQQQLYRARDRLTQQGIACYEADIRPTERFLCERFITAAIDVDAHTSRSRCTMCVCSRVIIVPIWKSCHSTSKLITRATHCFQSPSSVRRFAEC